MFRQNILFGGGSNHSAKKCSKKIRKDKEKARTAGDSDKQRIERTPHKYFIYESVDNLIDKCPKPPKDKGKLQNIVRFNESGNGALKKES